MNVDEYLKQLGENVVELKRKVGNLERFRIYIAGPYSPVDHDHNRCVGEAEANVREAIRIGNELMHKGHYVFVPHLSHYQANAPNGDHTLPWYMIDNTFIDNWANALFYISPSKGADAELARAKEKGYKIFYNLDEVPNLGEIDK